MRRIYPLDDWFSRPPDGDGKTRLLLRFGADYHCSQASFCQQLRTAATQRHRRIAVCDLGDRVAVAITEQRGQMCQP